MNDRERGTKYRSDSVRMDREAQLNVIVTAKRQLSTHIKKQTPTIIILHSYHGLKSYALVLRTSKESLEHLTLQLLLPVFQFSRDTQREKIKNHPKASS